MLDAKMPRPVITELALLHVLLLHARLSMPFAGSYARIPPPKKSAIPSNTVVSLSSKTSESRAPESYHIVSSSTPSKVTAYPSHIQP